MSHHLESNRSAFSKPAWHGLGKIIRPEDSRNLEDFILAANMGYEVSKEPAYALVDGGYIAIPNQWHIMRSDDQRIVSPNTVGNRYTPLQPRALFEVADPYIREGWASPDAAFTLYGGSSEVLTLRLDLQGTVNGDSSRWENYLILQNFHGRGAMRGRIARIRVVCHNTATAAFSEGADFSIRHSSSVEQRMKDAVAAWGNLKAELEAMSLAMGPLTSRVLTATERDSAIRKLAGIGATDDPNRRYVNILEAMFYSPGISGKGTAYDLIQAVTYINSHGGNKGSQMNRVQSLLDGAKANLERKATKMMLELV